MPQKQTRIKVCLGTLLIAAIFLHGCFEANTGHRRFFSYRQPKHKATVELAENPEIQESSNNINFTQAKVNESLERLKKALENSKHSRNRQTDNAITSKLSANPYSGNSDTIIVNDPDSLAAKLSETQETSETYNKSNKLSSNNLSNYNNSTNKNSNSEKPVITPIKKHSKYLTEKDFSSSPSIKIVKIEPVILPDKTLTQNPAAHEHNNIGNIEQNKKQNPYIAKTSYEITRTQIQNHNNKQIANNNSVNAKSHVNIELKHDNSAKTNTLTQTNQMTQKANQSIKLDLPAIESDPNRALEHLVKKLEKKIKDNPNDTATVVKLRLIQALLGQYQLAMQDKSNQENLKGAKLANNLAQLVKIFSDDKLSQAQQINQAADIVEQMRDRLSEIADLKISEPKLCREVQSFGSYKLMPASYFVAGKKLPVIVYIELEHFVSKYNEKQHIYTTELALTIEIIDPISGTVCWRHHDEYIKDISQNRRRDFYIARLITLPPSLPTGKLKLKVTVEDLTGNKVAQNITSFVIHKP